MTSPNPFPPPPEWHRLDPTCGCAVCAQMTDAPEQVIIDPQYVEIQALRAELDALHYVTDERSRELDAARAHIAQLETALATADRAYEAARAFAEKYIGDDVPRGLVPVQYEDIVALAAVPAAETEGPTT
jgi:hypothetical protein